MDSDVTRLRRAVADVLRPLMEVYRDLCRLEDRELGLAGLTPEDDWASVEGSPLPAHEATIINPAAEFTQELMAQSVLVAEANREAALPTRRGGRRPRGHLGRASSRVVEPKPAEPRRALGRGLAEIRREKEGDMRLRHRMAGLFAAPVRSAEVESAAPDWSPVPPGESRDVQVDGGGSFEAAT